MGESIRVNIWQIMKMVKACSLNQIKIVSIVDSLNMDAGTVLEYRFGRRKHMKENGSTITFMGKEYWFGVILALAIQGSFVMAAITESAALKKEESSTQVTGVKD